jgi:secreted PhoX family phosphatase
VALGQQTQKKLGPSFTDGALDPQGNVYGISETAPVPVPPAGPGGYIFKFVPDRRGDLSSGQLYALKIIVPTGDRTGEAIWLPLDRAEVQLDADQAATEAGATGYTRPEDIEIATDTGNARGGNKIMWVAVTGEHRVLRIDLRENARRRGPGHGPSGIYFDKSGTILYVNVQHRGAPDTRDLGMIITEARKR